MGGNHGGYAQVLCDGSTAAPAEGLAWAKGDTIQVDAAWHAWRGGMAASQQAAPS